MRILITGVNGFIGLPLFRALASRGYCTRGSVRTSSLSAVRREAGWGADIVPVADIGPETDWSAALKGIDVIVHLAGRAHVIKEKEDDPLAAFRHVNAEGTKRIALTAAKAGVRRFVYISSIGVNGEQSGTTGFTEKDQPAPTRPYAVSKWEAEKVLLDIADRTGMEIVILRPPLVYGPGAKGNMLKLMNYIYRQCPLPLGGIHNRRSLIALDNLIDAIVLTVKSPAAAGQLFLVSDGEDVSTSRLVRLIGDAMGKKTRLFTVWRPFLSWACQMVPPFRKKFLQLAGSLVVDNRKFKNVMDWKPPCKLDQGIEAMVSHYLDERGQCVRQKTV